MATIAHLAVEVDFDVDDKGAKRVTASIRDIEDTAQRADTRIDDLGDGLDRVTRNSDKSVKAAGRLSRAFTAIRGAGLVAILAAILGALPAAAVLAAGAIVLGLGGALATVGIIGAAQSKKVRKAWAKEIETIKKTIKTISEPFIPVLMAIANMFGDTFRKFTPELKAAFKDIAPAIENFAGAFFVAFEQLQPAIKPITDAFVRLLNELGPQLPGIFEMIAGGLIAVADAIGQNPEKFTNLVVGIFALVSAIFHAIAFITRFSNVFLGIVIVLGIVAAAFGGPVIAIAGVIAAIVALLAIVAMNFPAIKDFVVSAWRKVKSFTIGVWNTVWGFLKGIWSSITSFIGNQVNRARAFIGRLAEIPGRIRAFFGRAKNAAVNQLNRLVGFVRSIPGRIRNAVGNLGRLLWNAGRAVIEGLVNGIKSAVGWLQDTLSWVGGLIPDWKGPLRDDRKMLNPAGQAIMSGLIDGIAAQRGVLRSELMGVGRDAQAMMGRAADRFAFSTQAELGGRFVAPPGVRRAAASPTVLELRSGGSRLDDLLVQVLQKAIRERGGDTVKVLGGTR